MKRYQDFVLKDGKFIGDFERMYQSHDDPWGQSVEKYYSSISRRAVCYFIDYYNIRSIVEFGCGLGRTSNFIKENTGIKILGVDISQTSIGKKQDNLPRYRF